MGFDRFAVCHPVSLSRKEGRGAKIAFGLTNSGQQAFFAGGGAAWLHQDESAPNVGAGLPSGRSEFVK